MIGCMLQAQQEGLLKMCTGLFYIAHQSMLMLQERAKQAKQAAMQAELTELQTVLQSKQATVQVLRTSDMHAQVWQTCFVA